MNETKDIDWTSVTRVSYDNERNKAGYTAQDAPSTRLKINGDGRTDGHNLLLRGDGASKNMGDARP